MTATLLLEPTTLAPKLPDLISDPVLEIDAVSDNTDESSKRKRRKKNSTFVMYFTDDTEKSIIEFNKETNDKRRNEIYNEHIKYPFEKLAENILNTFKFSYFDVGPLDVQKEVVSHLVQNIHKFKEGKGKAYSYFSIIAKHYLILQNNTNYKKFHQQTDINDQPFELKELVVQPVAIDKISPKKEFLNLMIMFWENNLYNMFKKQKDLDIANAIIELFRKCDRLENFNKKALYLYVREITDCRTQHITKVINRMKSTHTYIARQYRNDGTLDVSEKIMNNNNFAMEL
jgi:hypothetical protein